MRQRTTRRTLAALALGLCSLFGFAYAAPAASAPAPALAASSDPAGLTATTSPGSEDEFEPGDAADWVKDNAALVIVVVGVLLVIGFWKFITR